MKWPTPRQMECETRLLAWRFLILVSMQKAAELIGRDCVR